MEMSGLSYFYFVTSTTLTQSNSKLVEFRNILPLEISILNSNILDIAGDKNANKSNTTTFKNTRNKITNRNKQNTRKDI